MQIRSATNLLGIILLACVSIASADKPPRAAEQHLLYVALPGIRADLIYGGAGILVFDMDNSYKFVRRIPTRPADARGNPDAMKGICANAATHRLYFSTPKSLTCIDLLTDKIVWTKTYPGGCDRMSMSPDGKTIFVPSFEGDTWNVINGASGEPLSTITTHSGAHNTVFSRDGKRVYLAGLKSTTLTIADAQTHQAVGTVGPFGGNVRPFTVNGKGTHCYCCVNGLLGFEIGDLTTGKVIARVETPGFEKGATKRHGCPSHGIAMTPDETELWLSDAHNRTAHVFDATATPPRLIASISLREEPGWITMSLDGRFAIASTGEVIDVKSKKIIATLEDETGRDVHSEKLLEIDFADGVPTRAGDQFGRGDKD